MSEPYLKGEYWWGETLEDPPRQFSLKTKDRDKALAKYAEYLKLLQTGWRPDWQTRAVEAEAERDRLRKELDDLKLTFEDKTDSNVRRVWKKMTDMALRQRDEAKAEIDRLREALTKLETESKFFRPAIEHIAKLDGTYVHVAINAVATAATALHALAKEAGK